MEFTSAVINHCKQRHSEDIELSRENLLSMALSPVLCAHPDKFFKKKSKVVDPESTSEVRQKALINAGTLFSNRLEEIIYYLAEKPESTFEDVPHHLTDGLIELVRNYVLCFTAWKEIHSAYLYGKSWNSIHKLEHAVIISEDTNRIQQGHKLIKQLRTLLHDAFGQETVTMLNAEIVKKSIKLAVDAKIEISKAISGRELEPHVGIIRRARQRVTDLGGEEAARQFNAEVYPE